MLIRPRRINAKFEKRHFELKIPYGHNKLYKWKDLSVITCHKNGTTLKTILFVNKFFLTLYKLLLNENEQ